MNQNAISRRLFLEQSAGVAGTAWARAVLPSPFICDGSSLVSSTRGQPTMTIMALAFRAADRTKEVASNGDV